jgi:hypothetical protein
MTHSHQAVIAVDNRSDCAALLTFEPKSSHKTVTSMLGRSFVPGLSRQKTGPRTAHLPSGLQPCAVHCRSLRPEESMEATGAPRTPWLGLDRHIPPTAARTWRRCRFAGIFHSNGQRHHRSLYVFGDRLRLGRDDWSSSQGRVQDRRVPSGEVPERARRPRAHPRLDDRAGAERRAPRRPARRGLASSLMPRSTASSRRTSSSTARARSCSRTGSIPASWSGRSRSSIGPSTSGARPRPA